MSQEDVLIFLKENKGRWFTAREMADKIKISYSTITTNLCRLMRFGMVKFKPIKPREYTHKNG